VAEIVRLKRKPRPLTATYQPNAPYVVEREDADDGSIHYQISDTRPGSFRYIGSTVDSCGDNPYAKHDAEQIAKGLNMLVQYGLETLPAVRDTDSD
jgi:hypothetical protein